MPPTTSSPDAGASKGLRDGSALASSPAGCERLQPPGGARPSSSGRRARQLLEARRPGGAREAARALLPLDGTRPSFSGLRARQRLEARRPDGARAPGLYQRGCDGAPPSFGDLYQRGGDAASRSAADRTGNASSLLHRAACSATLPHPDGPPLHATSSKAPPRRSSIDPRRQGPSPSNGFAPLLPRPAWSSTSRRLICFA